MKQALFVLMGVLAGFLLAGVVFFVSRLPSGETIALLPAPTLAPIAVDVTGAVVRPGLYKFPDGSRIQDAIDAAGGLLADADTKAINLAARLEDGKQLDIPYKEGTAPAAATEAPVFSYSEPDGTNPVSTSESPNDAELIDINTATLEQLDTLPGVGPATAQKIIDYRTTNGPFGTIEDIMKVPGIGPATFDNMQSLITVGE
jgi:competence protein ComEA